MLPAVLTGLRARRLPDTLLPRLLAEAPARLFGLWPRKGAIAVGADADFAIVDDRTVAPVDPARFHGKARHSPFAGEPLTGRVEHVLLRGKPAFARGEVIAPEGLGRFLNPREG
jgi:dihydroorotase-like cyclic amidohydrolase